MGDFFTWLGPNLLYVVLIGAGWLAVLAMFVPGTGILEIAAGAGLLLGAAGAISQGANAIGLALLVGSFVLFGVVMLRMVALAKAGHEVTPRQSPFMEMGLVAAAIQGAGGLLLFINVPGVSAWLVLLLALASLAAHRFMLLPAAAALRPQPQTGEEALIGAVAVARGAQPVPGGAVMVYLQGELWQAVADAPLSPGDRVAVAAREGMRLHVRKLS